MNRSGHRARTQFAEVSDWFNARNCHDPFAFESICEVLGIDPNSLRRGLQRLRHQAKPGPQDEMNGTLHNRRIRRRVGG
jgi:hypothetical protein